MRLNPDCIRDILLEVEETTAPNKFFEYHHDKPDLYPRLSAYSDIEIRYHIKQCDMAGYFSDVHYYMNTNCLILDLTPKAHQFLSDIREDNNWNKTKEIAKSVGSNSLDVLRQIASSVITSLIQAKIGL